MNLLNKWIRVIHRWLAVPLVLAVAAALIGSAAGGGSELPSWIGLAALLTLLSLLVTGVYLSRSTICARYDGRDQGLLREIHNQGRKENASEVSFHCSCGRGHRSGLDGRGVPVGG